MAKIKILLFFIVTLFFVVAILSLYYWFYELEHSIDLDSCMTYLRFSLNVLAPLSFISLIIVAWLRNKKIVSSYYFISFFSLFFISFTSGIYETYSLYYFIPGESSPVKWFKLIKKPEIEQNYIVSKYCKNQWQKRQDFFIDIISVKLTPCREYYVCNLETAIVNNSNEERKIEWLVPGIVNVRGDPIIFLMGGKVNNSFINVSAGLKEKITSVPEKIPPKAKIPFVAKIKCSPFFFNISDDFFLQYGSGDNAVKSEAFRLK